jgi:hypothetical protein
MAHTQTRIDYLAFVLKRLTRAKLLAALLVYTDVFPATDDLSKRQLFWRLSRNLF